MFGDERELVDEAFASNYIAPCGPMVERFERALTDNLSIPYVCVLSSCTGALDLLFHELGIGTGDTIFCSNLTFIASIAPAVHRGAEPVFIGSDPATWTISPRLLEEALHDAARRGKLPKAVVAVDLYGQCCDYEAIEPICAQYSVPLVVDSAEALGAIYCGHGVDAMESVKGGGCRQAGDAGVAAVYSFNGNKIITSSGGGALASRDEGIIQRALKRSQQSREKKVWYEHAEVGFNYRMSNVVAAIGLGQLMNLDQIVERKRALFDVYTSALDDVEGLEFMPEAAYGSCSRWLTVLTLPVNSTPGPVPHDGVLQVIEALEMRNIESRPVWKPMHLQPVFKSCKVYGGEADQVIFNTGICLPSGTGMQAEEARRVADIVRYVLEKI